MDGLTLIEILAVVVIDIDGDDDEDIFREPVIIGVALSHADTLGVRVDREETVLSLDGDNDVVAVDDFDVKGLIDKLAVGEDVPIDEAEPQLVTVPVAELDTELVGEGDIVAHPEDDTVEHDVTVTDPDNELKVEAVARADGVDVEEIVDDGEVLTVLDFSAVND
jgi:hypothetical protein